MSWPIWLWRTERWPVAVRVGLRALLYALAISALVVFAEPGAQVGIYEAF